MKQTPNDSFIHPTACVEENVVLGNGVKIWHFCHVREGVSLGEHVSLGRDVYIDKGVNVGRQSRIQNGVSVYSGVVVGEWCFVGPHVIFTNDLYPRAGLKQWKVVETNLELGMSLGAGAIVRCGVTIGAFAMIGAGAVVTKSISPFHLYLGMPARYEKMICACGRTTCSNIIHPGELIRDCCEDGLSDELCAMARSYISTNEQTLMKSINNRRALKNLNP